MKNLGRLLACSLLAISCVVDDGGDDGSANTSTTTATTDDDGGSSECADPEFGGCDPSCGGTELDPVIPSACQGIDLPELGEDVFDRAAALTSPTRILIANIEEYQCAEELDPDELQCPCIGDLRLYPIALADATYEQGTQSVTYNSVSASLDDTCSRDDEGPFEADVEILAVTETCIVGELPLFDHTLRFHADRSVCNP